MHPKWSLKRDIDTFLGKTCSNEDPKRDDGHKIGKNVTEISGRHWNMKKLCPGKAKFFR